MDNYTFEHKKDTIFSDYFREFHKAFCDEANISDINIGRVTDEIKIKYNKLLKNLYLDFGKEYNDNTFDEEYQKGKNKYCR
ncbi:hypothetical protein [Faecalispora jeddahensis]|uniref:hypothetical protein n=1 Tax=Faecalispora jeddahensis TaxID=1414721 RepID=UPI00189994DE|nr:hypothetical protein [Faecalispora jeddahensis]